MSEDINLTEYNLMSKELQLDLAKGDLSFEEETIQYFIPAVYAISDIDFLRIIAENILIEEDCKVVMGFLDKFESLANVNAQLLNEAVINKLKKMR